MTLYKLIIRRTEIDVPVYNVMSEVASLERAVTTFKLNTSLENDKTVLLIFLLSLSDLKSLKFVKLLYQLSIIMHVAVSDVCCNCYFSNGSSNCLDKNPLTVRSENI